MQLRSLALTATLFVMGCASAPPPNQDSPTAGESTAAAQATAAPAKPAEAPAASAQASSAPSAAPAASASASASAKPTDNDHPFSGGDTLSQADIAKILEKNGALFDECYTIGAGGDKTKAFSATVTVQATLSPTGAVNVVKVLKSTAKDKKVDKCVSTAFKKIQFPAPNKGTGTSVITFPLSFGREEVK